MTPQLETERETGRERERDRDCEGATAGVRQGGLQKEQRKQYPLQRGGGRQGGGVGLLPAASVQENRSHFWTLPHSPVSSLVHLRPRVCSPRALRGIAGPSPVRGPGVGWACCPAHSCSLPETQGEALTRQPRSSCFPTPHSKSGSSSPFLPHPAPRWALPSPGVPRTMDPPREPGAGWLGSWVQWVREGPEGAVTRRHPLPLHLSVQDAPRVWSGR